MLPRTFFLLASFTLVACGSSGDDVSPGTDTGTTDTNVADTAKGDTATGDTASGDSATGDTATGDTATGDTATVDAADAATDSSTDAATDTAADGGSCGGDGDCRKFSSYCDVCACLPLGATDPDPVCHGTTITCFVDPCNGKSAACVGGKCVIR